MSTPSIQPTHALITRCELRFAKCNDLLTKIRETETQIITLTNEKINMSNELRAITTKQDTNTPDGKAQNGVTELESQVSFVQDGQQASPLIRDAQKLTKELKRSEIQEKLSDTLATAFTRTFQTKHSRLMFTIFSVILGKPAAFFRYCFDSPGNANFALGDRKREIPNDG